MVWYYESFCILSLFLLIRSTVIMLNYFVLSLCTVFTWYLYRTVRCTVPLCFTECSVRPSKGKMARKGGFTIDDAFEESEEDKVRFFNLAQKRQNTQKYLKNWKISKLSYKILRVITCPGRTIRKVMVRFFMIKL